MNPAEAAKDVTDFQRDVLDASRHVPVLADFWAPWCGPCRVLGPILDKLAREQEGKWKLAKVNTDANPEVSARYGIRGIPAVKLFVDGQVVDEFTGALPEYAVRQWLEKALPSENKKRLERAQTAIASGDAETAEGLLELVLGEEPENPEAKLLLARLIVFRDPERAEALAKGAEFVGPAYVLIEEAIKTIARLMRLNEQPEPLPDEPGKEAYFRAVQALAKQDYDSALSGFIEVLGQNRYYDDDGPRKACVALFTLLGEQHPVTQKHRRTFDMALY